MNVGTTVTLSKFLFCKGLGFLTCPMGGWALNSPPLPDSLEDLED